MKWFDRMAVLTATIVLLSTAILKALTLAMGRPDLLNSPDPLLPVSTRAMLIAALLVEAGVLFLIFRAGDKALKGLAITVAAAEFLVYHAAAAQAGYKGRCPCLGALWDWVGLNEQWANALASLLAFSLFLSGISLLVRNWPGRKFE